MSIFQDDVTRFMTLIGNQVPLVYTVDGASYSDDSTMHIYFPTVHSYPATIVDACVQLFSREYGWEVEFSHSISETFGVCVTLLRRNSYTNTVLMAQRSLLSILDRNAPAQVSVEYLRAQMFTVDGIPDHHANFVLYELVGRRVVLIDKYNIVFRNPGVPEGSPANIACLSTDNFARDKI